MPSAAFASVTETGEETISKNHKSTSASGNSVLSRLSESEYTRFLPYLESVPLTFGETVYKAKSQIEYVYFPESRVVSFVGITGKERPEEVGLVGNEGPMIFDLAKLKANACLAYRLMRHPPMVMVHSCRQRTSDLY